MILMQYVVSQRHRCRFDTMEISGFLHQRNIGSLEKVQLLLLERMIFL